MSGRRGRRWVHLLTYAVLAPAAVVTLVPFAWLLTSAFKAPQEFFGSMFLPRGDGFLGVAWDRLTTGNLTRLFRELSIGRAMLNSLFLSSVTSVLATLCCAAGGYALAMYRFRGRRVLTWVVLGALIVPPPLLLAPGYQVLYRLGLLDTYSGLILPAMAPAFGVFLFRQASLQSVPPQLLEAGRLDGCSEAGLFGRIALPLLRPMTGAFLLITFLGVWNNFIGPQIVLQSPEKQPLAVAIAQLKGVYYEDYGLLMAGTLVSIAPVAGLFLLLQKDFVSGLTLGAVK
ncbi:MAG: carbohydrate ABC transporter permease [Phycisphaerales bacterium]|nr:carbohydrate ABC transporter permease [Phycisphaerales bacterium]